MACELITDGYTISEKLRSGLAVQFRPLTGSEWSTLVSWCSKLEPEAAADRIADSIAKAVRDWNATANGETAPINAATVKQLPTDAYIALKNVVSGFDEDGNQRASIDEKNSEAG